MLGAVAGDIIGSVYERQNVKTPDFEPLFHPSARFTDDTVLSVAIADSILRGSDLVERFHFYARAYPDAGYGGTFRRWIEAGGRAPYASWGNGSAMRVSPVGFAYDDLAEVLRLAERTAEVTHNHPEGIKGARAVAAAVFLARTGGSKGEIRAYVERQFGYDLSRTVAEIRPTYQFDVSCQGSVPQALVAFLESTGYENAVRLAISLGGDSDTLACIAGGIAQAYYGGVPEAIRREALDRLDDRLRWVVEEFEAKYGQGRRGPGPLPPP